MATVTATPNPVPQGEQFKVEGVGFDLDVSVECFVDGDSVGTGSTRPSPEGGVVDFYTAVDQPGTVEVELRQGRQKASAEVDVLDGSVTAPQPPPEAYVQEEKSAKSEKASTKKGST